MKKYLEQVRRRVDDLRAKIIQIPREENEQADHLAKAASAEHIIALDNVLSFVQLAPLIDSFDVQGIGSVDDWTTPLVSYLKNGILPDRKEAARMLKVQAVRFILIKDVLYKRGFFCPYLRCLCLEEADYIMREVHEGFAGTTQGRGRWYTNSFERGTTGPPCRRMLKLMSKPVTSVKDSAMSSDSRPKS